MFDSLTRIDLPPELPATVEVWMLDVTRDTPRLAHALALLDTDERARHARFRQPGDAHRFALTRAGLRLLLGERLACCADRVSFRYGPHGKPMVEGMHFNVSHSGERALIALSGAHDVGIDIERHADEAPLEVLSSPMFSHAERDYCGRDAKRFYAVWCGKEALAKALGTGFTTTPATAVPASSGRYLVSTPGVSVWSLAMPSGYSAALAIDTQPALRGPQ